jgi:hypothetical protein
MSSVLASGDDPDSLASLGPGPVRDQCCLEPQIAQVPVHFDGDTFVTETITMEYLSGQILAQNTLIHVLFGECVIDNPDEAFALRDALTAALRNVRRSSDASGDEQLGCIETLEAAIEALECMRLDPGRK